ncbi:hypothetical protein [Persicobacter diffluens]
MMKRFFYILMGFAMACCQPNTTKQATQRNEAAYVVFNQKDTTMAYVTSDTTALEIISPAGNTLLYTFNPFVPSNKFVPYKGALTLGENRIVSFVEVNAKQDTSEIKRAYFTKFVRPVKLAHGVLKTTFMQEEGASKLKESTPVATKHLFEKSQEEVYTKVKGLIYIPAAGDYRFTLGHSKDASLFVIDNPLLEANGDAMDSTIYMQPGFFPMEIYYTSDLAQTPKVGIHSKYIEYDQIPDGLFVYKVTDPSGNEINI